MFELFDYPYPIKLVRITEGHTDQNTGEWVPGSEDIVDLKGHISDISIEELSRMEGSMLSPGDRKLIVDRDYGIEIGDEIRIYEDESGADITSWQVVAIQNFKNIIEKYTGEKRVTIYLKRKI